MDIPAAKALNMSIYGNAPRKALSNLTEGKRKQYEELDNRYKQLQNAAKERRNTDNVQYMEENPSQMYENEDMLRFYAGAGGLHMEDTALERIFGNPQAVPPILPDERLIDRIRMDLRSKVLADKSQRKFGPLAERSLKNYGAAMDYETTTNNAYSYERTLAEKRREEGLTLFNRDSLY